MGTRSITVVYNEDNRPIINIYGQYDGYPSGHGVDIANFLSPIKLVNGISGRDENIANGMGCLAAQLLAKLKHGVGGFYIHPVDEVDCGQDYEYHIHSDKVIVKRYDGQVMFKGNWNEFVHFCYEDA